MSFYSTQQQQQHQQPSPAISSQVSQHTSHQGSQGQLPSTFHQGRPQFVTQQGYQQTWNQPGDQCTQYSQGYLPPAQQHHPQLGNQPGDQCTQYPQGCLPPAQQHHPQLGYQPGQWTQSPQECSLPVEEGHSRLLRPQVCPQPGCSQSAAQQASSGNNKFPGFASSSYTSGAPATRPSPITGPQPSGSSQLVSKVELRVECRNLLDKDYLSKSDPCAVLYMFNSGICGYVEIGRTEIIVNCLDPRFSRAFLVDYYFEEAQKVKISVYDIDNTTPQLSDDDFLGEVETTLGQLVSNTPFTLPLLLRSGQKAGNGVITCCAKEVKEGTESMAMTFRAQKLDKKDFFGKSDPYLLVQRGAVDRSWQVIHRTEVVKNNLNPSWQSFELPVQTLCDGNLQQPIKFDVYDWNRDGSHDHIGGFTTCLQEMLGATQQEVSFACVNPIKRAKKKGYVSSGTVRLSSCRLIKNHTFLDFIFSGMQINFTIGIDFTGSNGHPSKPTSLHYVNHRQPNEYMCAIRAVGDVCQDYDTDKMFPVLGFGARIPPSSEVSHEFAVNFNPHNPFCAGIDGVLQAYCHCIQHVELYGPTNAAPIIRHVTNFAISAQQEEGQKGAHAYFILLMLTDGVLSDMSNARQAIVTASRFPISLIIVGVGGADFSDMDALDADDGVLKAPCGDSAVRDIVQFVPFRRFRQVRESSSAELSRHVLAEVPKQVTEYYKMRGTQPSAPRT